MGLSGEMNLKLQENTNSLDIDLVNENNTWLSLIIIWNKIGITSDEKVDKKGKY